MPNRPAVHRPVRPGTPHAQAKAPAGPRLYDSLAWRKARAAFLQEHPLCVTCLKDSPPRYTPAAAVDHVIPHKGDHGLFWQVSNWQALCVHHHNAKSATERQSHARTP